MCSGAPRDPSVIRSGKITAMCFKEEAKEHAKAVKATIAMFRIAIPPNSTGKVVIVIVISNSTTIAITIQLFRSA